MGKIAVIGAGISGLVAGWRLQAMGHEVVIYEKSRSLSGRCSTRLWNQHIVDHGAQYFTVSTDIFREDLDRIAGDQIRVIESTIVDENHTEIPATGGRRYYHLQGNNRLGKPLTHSLQIKRETTVERLESVAQKWKVNGDLFDVVLMTCPWPQIALLLDQYQQHEEIMYSPCLTTFFEFGGEWQGTSQKHYAISSHHPDEPLAWSACENHKRGRISGDATVFVVQASERFSQQWLESALEDYVPHLLARLQAQWGLTQLPTATFSHRWRYARKSTSSVIPALSPGLFVAGDSRVESKIEAVWLDGRRVAEEIDQYLA